MNYIPLIVCGGLGFFVSLFLIPVIRRHTASLSFGAPGRTFHHTHKAPVSRLGGIALAAAFVAVTLAAFIWLPVTRGDLMTRLVIAFASLAMFGLGLWDDLHPLGARKKLLAQILIAAIVCSFGISIQQFRDPFSNRIYDLGYFGWAVTIFWIVALTNMINLIDGIDGLAGGIALMVMGLLVFVGTKGEISYANLVATGMFGALLGFLRYNFPPAKIYMGDGGAYFLGFLIAVLTLVNSQKGTVMAAMVAPMFALALPILDVTIAVLRRGLRGLPIFRADRKHLHHKLQQAGLSRTRTVLILYGLSSIFLLMAFGVFWSQGRWVPILFGFLCLTLLLSARTFNFSRDWFAVGRVLENSLELRKEIHYALALSRWLEMEAERSVAMEKLWDDFTFMAGKLDFTRVGLMLDDGERQWQSPGQAPGSRGRRKTHDLGGAHLMRLEFTAEESEMSEKLFEHLCELSAEAWLKAANRWHALNELPIQFQSRIPRPAAKPVKTESLPTPEGAAESA